MSQKCHEPASIPAGGRRELAQAGTEVNHLGGDALLIKGL